MTIPSRFVVIRDASVCRFHHNNHSLDNLVSSEASTANILDKSFVFPTASRVAIVDLCRTETTAAVAAGLTLRNSGYFVVFDVCSDDPSDLINDLYNESVENDAALPVRGEAIVAEAALALSKDIEQAILYFEQEFL